MPLHHYGVLKTQAIDRRLAGDENAHYQIHAVADNTDYRLAVNVSSSMSPPDLLYLIEPQFQHPVLRQIVDLEYGWHPLESRPEGPALDYVRSNLFLPEDMTVLPYDVPGADNDLNEKLDRQVQRAIDDTSAELYAFGVRWGPERGRRDKIFGFNPGNGVHDIHMNQGNSGRFVEDDGVYQDGALLLHFPEDNQWIGIFLKFQSQSWHTDDRTGHQRSASPSTIRQLRGIADAAPPLAASKPALALRPQTPDLDQENPG